MADPRLRWNELQAPDLSAASEAVARANQAFSKGMGSGGSLLDVYAKGVQEKADNAILTDIAKLKDEQDFQAFVDSGALNGRNISDEMRNYILGMRSNFVKDEGVRADTQLTNANTENTRATTGINLARESRSAAEWKTQMARDQAARDAAGDIEAARSFASQYGDTVGPITEYNGVQGRVYKGLLDRGIPEHIAQGFMMNFQDESGFNVAVTEATPNAQGTRGKGLYQLTGDRRAAFEARYGNDYSIDNQLDFMVSELGGKESAAWKAIQNTKTAGEAGAAIVSKFLRPAEKHRAARSAAYLGSSGGTPSYVTERDSPVQAVRQRLIDTHQFTAAEIDDMLAGAIAAGKERSADLLAEDQKKQAEAIAAAARDALLDPANTNSRDMGKTILTDPTMSATAQQAALEAAKKLAEQNPDLLSPTQKGVPNDPDLAPDAKLAAASDQIQADMQASIDARPEVQLYDDIKKFSEGDPAKQLQDTLGLGTDGQDATDLQAFFSQGAAGYDINNLRNLIRDYAREFNVDEPTAAAAMRQAFVRDPVTILGWNANTLENRFNKSDVGQIIKDSLSQEQISKGRELRNQANIVQAEIADITRQIVDLQQQASKGADRGQTDQKIAQLMIQLGALRAQHPDFFPKKDEEKK